MSSQIVTYTGRVVDPLNLDPDKINIVDIAHSLSNQCRFTGHVREFYSVAQHSVLAADFAVEEYGPLDKGQALTVLLHDASEAYLSDLARPVKHAMGLGPIYRQVEDAIQAVIAEKFNLIYPFPFIVHAVDNALLAAEQRDLMPRHRHLQSDLVYPHGISGWAPEDAKKQYLDMYEAYTGIKPRR